MTNSHRANLLVQILGGGAAVAILIVVLVVWKPWSTGGADGESAEHAAHDDNPVEFVELSESAIKTLGLTEAQGGIEPAKVSVYDLTIDIPGVVVHRSGISRRLSPAPMTGIVEDVYVIEGEAVTTGQDLFDVHLTHAELVQAQGDYLRAATELKVVEAEIQRLERISRGVVSGKDILDRKYEKQKLQAVVNALKERLLLHGLSEPQLKEIVERQKLEASMIVTAPGRHVHPHDHGHDHKHASGAAEPLKPTEPEKLLFLIEKLNVAPGAHVEAGDPLCVLADNQTLHIEGLAFARDIPHLKKVMKRNKTVKAVFDGEDRHAESPNLKIEYLGSHVEANTLKFYVFLPNVKVRDVTIGRRRFVDWRYRPGQRATLRVPIDTWRDDIVVPLGAVVTEGARSYVFRKVGNRFERIDVHVKHRGTQEVVIANDGQIYPGDIYAKVNAYQLHLEIKNRSAGPVDPHAGHSH